MSEVKTNTENKKINADGDSRQIDLLVIQPFYKDDYTTIYHNDCLIAMIALRPHRESVVIITDPPYGIGAYANGTMGGGILAKQSRFEKTDWDNEQVPPIYFEMMKYISKNQIIFGGNYFNLGGTKSYIIWDKDNGENNFADCELAWTSFDKAVRKIKHKWQGMLQQNMSEKEKKFHPTQKPLPVMQWIIENYTTPADLILDPFMGSGSALVSAKKLGRKAIGVEVEEKWCEVAVKRLAQYQLF